MTEKPNQQWRTGGDCRKCYNRHICGKECAAHADRLSRQARKALLLKADQNNAIFRDTEGGDSLGRR